MTFTQDGYDTANSTINAMPDINPLGGGQQFDRPGIVCRGLIAEDCNGRPSLGRPLCYRGHHWTG